MKQWARRPRFPIGKRTKIGTGTKAKILEPFDVSEHLWFYVDGKDVMIVQEKFDGNGDFIHTEPIHIPTRILRKALALLETLPVTTKPKKKF